MGKISTNVDIMEDVSYEAICNYLYVYYYSFNLFMFIDIISLIPWS